MLITQDVPYHLKTNSLLPFGDEVFKLSRKFLFG